MIRPDHTMVELDDDEEEPHDMKVQLSAHLAWFFLYYLDLVCFFLYSARLLLYAQVEKVNHWRQ